jgi:DNA-binding transcriptional LysR family regulator
MIDDLSQTSGVADRHLRVFLSVVESGSFTRAGHRLGLGQPAVSHVIKQLEKSLGARVFNRDSGRVVLTDAGRRLAEGVRSGFDSVDRAVRGFRREGRANEVELSVSTPLATYWLMPRLGDFRLLHPDVELRISTCDTDRLVGVDDADLWVPLGEGDWPNLVCALFHHERIYPVAEPRHPLARPDTEPAALLEADLLVHAERGRARFDWEDWFALHGQTPPTAVTALRFSDYSLVVRAALAGQGVALGWHHIVRDLVEDGFLARVSDREVVTDNPFVVLARPASLQRPAVRVLWDWLIASAEGTRAAPGKHDSRKSMWRNDVAANPAATSSGRPTTLASRS